jgi:TfoX/Sxy family transcriptional regulator of competence genes
MPKATDEDKSRFRSLITEAPGVEVKPMFGQLGAFVNGNMFAGLFAPQVGVKLAPEDASALAGLGGGPFGPEERPMGGYLSLPAGLGDDEARDWVERAREYVATFPPKAKK